MICKAIGELKLVSYRMERDSKLLFYKKNNPLYNEKRQLRKRTFCVVLCLVHSKVNKQNCTE